MTGIDPALADLIKVVIGAIVVFLGKGIRDLVQMRREGKSLHETNLVTSLTTAITRLEAEAVRRDTEHDAEVRVLKADLNHRTDERDYWRNRNGSLEYLLSREQIPFEPAKTDIARRSINERPE